jgi:hypothetical protein
MSQPVPGRKEHELSRTRKHLEEALLLLLRGNCGLIYESALFQEADQALDATVLMESRIRQVGGASGSGYLKEGGAVTRAMLEYADSPSALAARTR